MLEYPYTERVAAAILQVTGMVCARRLDDGKRRVGPIDVASVPRTDLPWLELGGRVVNEMRRQPQSMASARPRVRRG